MPALVVIPAYNEAAVIASVVAGVRATTAIDIVVIDDGSSDETAAEARRAGAVVLRHPCNLGIGAAVQTGYLYGLSHGYDAVVRLDGDGQHDPAYISHLLRLLKNDEADVVIGSRFLARQGFQSTLVRRLGIAVLEVLSALVGTHVTDPTSGYWALNARALEVLARLQADDYPETEGLVRATRAGCRVREVPAVMQERAAGRSSITALYSGFYMVKVILAVLIEQLRRR